MSFALIFPISIIFKLTDLLVIQVRLQLDNVREKKFKGSFHCAQHLLSQYGPRSFTCGFWVNAVREATFGAFYFAIYEVMKREISNRLPHSNHSQNPLAVMIGGGLAGMAGWLSSFPFDVIKSIIQVCILQHIVCF